MKAKQKPLLSPTPTSFEYIKHLVIWVTNLICINLDDCAIK